MDLHNLYILVFFLNKRNIQNPMAGGENILSFSKLILRTENKNKSFYNVARTLLRRRWSVTNDCSPNCQNTMLLSRILTITTNNTLLICLIPQLFFSCIFPARVWALWEQTAWLVHLFSLHLEQWWADGRCSMDGWLDAECCPGRLTWLTCKWYAYLRNLLSTPGFHYCECVVTSL